MRNAGSWEGYGRTLNVRSDTTALCSRLNKTVSWGVFAISIRTCSN